MQRLLKRLLHNLVPRWVAHRIRDRIEQQLNAGPVIPITVQRIANSLRAQVGEHYAFFTPIGCQMELDFHTNTQEGRAELSGIAAAALRGGTLFDIGAHAGMISALFCAARARSLADTGTMPVASMSTATSPWGTPRGAGAMPVSSNMPSFLL